MQELQTRKETIVYSTGDHTVEKQGGDTRTPERKHTPTPPHRTPRHHIKTEKIRGHGMVAQHEKRLGRDEEGMRGMQRKPTKPTKRKTQGDDHPRVPLPSPARGLLPPGRKGLPIGGRRILIMAHSGNMPQGRDISGAQRQPSEDIQHIWNSDDLGNRRRTPIHST